MKGNRQIEGKGSNTLSLWIINNTNSDWELSNHEEVCLSIRIHMKTQKGNTAKVEQFC